MRSPKNTIVSSEPSPFIMKKKNHFSGFRSVLQHSLELPQSPGAKLRTKKTGDSNELVYTLHVGSSQCRDSPNLSNQNNLMNTSNELTIDSQIGLIDQPGGLISAHGSEVQQLTKRVNYDLMRPNLSNEITNHMYPGVAQNQTNEKEYINSQTNYNFFFKRAGTVNKELKLIQSLTLKRAPTFCHKTRKQIQMPQTTEYSKKGSYKNMIQDESKKIRILLVEDETTIRRSQVNLIKSYCQRKKIKVIIEECSDGFECLNKLYTGFSLNHKYRCIITDDSMKFLNGQFMSYIIQYLITEQVLYPITIYLVSANDYPERTLHGMELFDEVFTKPITKDNLKTIFDSLHNSPLEMFDQE